MRKKFGEVLFCIKTVIEAIEEVYEDPFTPSEKNPLVAVQADNIDCIILKWTPDSSIESFTIYIYDNKKEKYCKYSSGDYDSGRAYIEDTVPETEYKILVRKFDDDGNIIFSEMLLCQEKSQNKQTKSYQPTRESEERAKFLYKFSKSTGERKSQ